MIYTLSLNTIDETGKKTLKSFYNYLHKYDLYNSMEECFISEQIVKPGQLEFRFGKELKLLKKYDSILFVDWPDKKRFSYTNVYGLDKGFLPSLSEIEMIREAHLAPLELMDPIITNNKFFDEKYDFNSRKQKNLKNENSNIEEIRERILQKNSLLLFDFYNEYDHDFRKKFITDFNIKNSLDEIYERISKNAIDDVKKVDLLKNANNQEVVKRILDDLNTYCITKKDYIKLMQDLLIEAKEKDIDISYTKEDLIKYDIMEKNSNQVDIEKMYNMMEKRLEMELNKKNIRIDQVVKMNHEDLELLFLKEQFKDLENIKSIKEGAKILAEILKMNHTNQFINHLEKKISLFDDKNNFEYVILDKDDNFLRLDRAKILIIKNLYEKGLTKKSGIDRIDDIGDHQVNWKDKNKSYKNEFLYETNCPYLLRGKNQFVCWKTEWVSSNKKIKDENGVEKLLPLLDKDNKPILDEKGNEIPDGKYSKVPYNPNVAYNQEKPYFSKAKANDDRTWSNFDRACKAVREYNYDGIGFMLGKGIIGIDVDHVIGADGNLTEETQWIISKTNSYTEYSPSKTGIHILMYGELPPGRRRNGNLEMYSEGRFFTLTGDIVDGAFKKIVTKESGTQSVKEVYDRFMPKELDLDKNSIKNKVIINWEDKKNTLGFTNQEIIDKLIASGERKKILKEIFNAQTQKMEKNHLCGINIEESLMRGDWEKIYDSQSSADYALVGKIWFYTDSPKQVDEIFRTTNLYRDKWDEYHGEKTYGQITIENIINRNDSNFKYNKDWKKEKLNTPPKVNLFAQE